MTASGPRSRLAWAPLRWSPAARYCTALAIVALTTGILTVINRSDWGFLAHVTIENPGTIFIAAVTFVALACGAGPGIVAVAASALALRLVFGEAESWSRLIVLLLTMLVIVVLADRQRRAQERAEGAQAKFEAIVGGMSDAVMVVDAAGMPSDVNDAAIAMLGARDRADALRHLSQHRADGTPATDEYALLRRALAGEESPRADVLIPDGTAGGRTVSAVANVLRDARGRALGAVSVSRDLTERLAQAQERERLLERVEREQAFTQHILANVPVGIAVLRADDFTVLSFNEEYDASIRAARGGGSLAVGEPFFAAIPPESDAPARQLLTAARERREVVRNSGYSAAVAPDRFYDGTIQRLILGDGSEALLITSVNVTDRVMAERERERLLGEIERERQFTRLILDSVPVSIAVFRPDDLTVLNANTNFEAYMRDVSGRQFAVGQRLLDVIPDMAESRFVRDIQSAQAENRPVIVTGYAALAPAGHYYDWTMQPLRLSDGGTGILATLMDVTARVEAERERERLLAEVERQAAQLAATFAAMVDGVSVYDTAGNVLHRNAAFYRLLRLDPATTAPVWEDFIQAMDLRLPDGTPMTREQTHSWRALHGETVRDEIIRVRDGLGRDRFVSQNASPIRAADGAVIGAVIVFNDVTERLAQEREREDLLRLVEERRRFTQAIFDTVPVCLAVVDTETMAFQAANPAFLDALPTPYRDVGVSGIPLLHALPHAETNGFRAQLQQVRETGQPLRPTATRYEHPIRGTTYWNETMVPFHTVESEHPRVLYIAADVTEQVTAEQRAGALALVAAERASQLEATIASLTEGLLLADTDGNIVQSNGALRGILGLDDDAPVPKLSTFGERFAMRSPGGMPIPTDERAGTVAMRGEVRTDQLRRFRTARGDERWMSVNASPIRDDTGEIRGVAMTVRDVTERLEQQRQIAAHTQQLEAIFASLTEGVLLSDTEGNILQCNAAVRHMLALPDDADMPPFPTWGEHFAMRTVDATAVPPEGRAWARAARGETVIDERRRFRTARGDERWMSVNASPVRDDTGTMTGMALTLRDVTGQLERERERERLLHLVEERRRFAQAIFDTVPIGLAVIDVEHESFSTANPAYLADLPEPYRTLGVNGVPIGKISRFFAEPEAAARLRGVCAGGEPIVRDAARYPHPTRGETYYNEMVVALPSATGPPTHALFQSVDVTEQVHAQERIAALASEAGERAAQLEAMFSSLAEGMMLTDVAGNIVQWNAAAERSLILNGAPLTTMRNFMERFALRNEDGSAIAEEELVTVRALRGETVTMQLRRFRDGHGQERWMSASAAPVRSETGAIIGVARTFRDVTEERRTAEERERLLAEIEERRRFAQTVIESAPVGIAVFATDPQFTVRIANDQYIALLDAQWRSRAIAGIGLDAFFPDTAEISVAAAFRSVIATGEPFSAREFPYDGFARGTVYLDWSIVPLREAADRVTGLLALVTDVTDRVLSRQRIEELADDAAQRAAELETIVASVPDGIAIHDAEGRLVQMNAAGRRLAGSALGGAIDGPMAIDDFGVRHTDGSPVERASLPLMRALRGETVSGVELMTGTDELVSYLLFGSAPIYGATGTITGAVVSFSDITPIKQVEQMKDEFISIAAHELRTPLTAIKGYTDLLDRRISTQDGRERDRQSLAIIRRQTDRLTGLVNEMLDVSRIEVGRFLLNPESFDLSALAREVVMNLRPSSETHTLTIAAEPGIAISADAARIEQVLINLVTNAIAYSPEGGSIAIRVWREGANAKIAVRDEGLGIAADALPHLFERFYRAPRAGMLRTGGMGLGLYISNEIVQRHGGTIAVESTEGAGSTFTVTLPLEARA